jgi:diaminopimelate decarboxylase
VSNIQYINNELFIEQLKVSDIAAVIPTPFYCYAQQIITDNFLRFQNAAKNFDPLICYAVKANPNLAIIKILAGLGAGADCVSEGEIRRALAAGVHPSKIVFSGVGKTENEMEFALSNNILQFNVESESELILLNKIATRLNKRAPVALRINPDVDAGTHAKITTGKKENKFGLELELAKQIFASSSKYPSIELVGISAHLGSQIMDLEPYELAYEKIIELYHYLTESGHRIKTIDVGGGLGISYHPDQIAPNIDDYISNIYHKFKDINCKIIIEPGRRLVANCGILVSKVLYNKQTESSKFVIIDAGMNDLLRPSMYDAYHDIAPVKAPTSSIYESVNIAGPVCESSDIFTSNRNLPPIEENALLAIKDVGAYGASMASHYNTRLNASEILVYQDKFSIIRKQLTYQQLLEHDLIPSWI